VKPNILVLRSSDFYLFEKTVRTHSYVPYYMRLPTHLHIVGEFGEIAQFGQGKWNPVLEHHAQRGCRE
jgi:hypothetical protein